MGSDAGISDGAGLLTDIPHGLLSNSLSKAGSKLLLPPAGTYITGHAFLPPSSTDRGALRYRPKGKHSGCASVLSTKQSFLPERSFAGILPDRDFLTAANRVRAGLLQKSPSDAHGLHVIMIGEGDTGSDCVGTALRQGARSVMNRSRATRVAVNL